MAKKFFGIAFLISFLFLWGCATERTVSLKDYPPRKEGIYHKVLPQETLWRIAKTYDVSVEELVRVNNIPNAAHIEKNQLLLIPGVGTKTEIIPVASTVSSQEAFTSDDFQWPIKGNIISYFGDQKSLWINNGVDIRANRGQDVYPARGGEVVFSDFLNGYGRTVIIDHRDGYSTVYSQNDEVLVSLGDFVTKETVISKAGGSQTLALLHFEVRKNSVAKNPLYFLP